MDEETITYLLLSMVVPLAALSFIPELGKGAFAILAALITLAGIAAILIMNWADFVLFSLVTTIFNVTFQPAGGYKIVKTQDAIVKNVNGLYYATGFVTANLFSYVFKQEEAVDQASEDARLIGAPDAWERAVMSISYPFKFHVLSTGLDVQKVRDELEGKRSYQEFQMSRAMQNASTNDMTITDLQRKINVLQTQINRISQGEKPIATIMYAETTAIGISEKAALDALTGQVSGLQVALGALDVDLIRVIGRELYTLFSFNFGLPTGNEEIASYFNQES
jgi:hypothetical protein